MAAGDFNVKSSAGWTTDSVKEHLRRQPLPTKGFIMVFYDWSPEEWKQAMTFIRDTLQRLSPTYSELLPPQGESRIGHSHQWAHIRAKVQTAMLHTRPDLFVDRHLDHRPDWFHESIINGNASGETIDTNALSQRCIVWAYNEWKGDIVAAGKEEDELSRPSPAKKARYSNTPVTLPTRTSTPFSRALSPRVTEPLRASLLFGSALNLGSDAVQPKLPMWQLNIIVVRPSVVGAFVQLDRSRFATIMDIWAENGSFDMDLFNEELEPHQASDHSALCYFFDERRNGSLKSAPSKLRIQSAIRELYRISPTGVTGLQLFSTSHRDVLDMIPLDEAYRYSNFADNVIVPARIDEAAAAVTAAAAQREKDEQEAAAVQHEQEEQAAEAAAAQRKEYEDEAAAAQREEIRKKATPSKAERVRSTWSHMVKLPPIEASGDTTESPIKPCYTIEARVVKQEWLSSGLKVSQNINGGYDVAKEDGAAEASDENATSSLGLVNKTFSTDQMTEGMWHRACAFFGFDPKHQSPKSGIWFESWTPTNPISAYQFYTVAWLVSKLLSNQPHVVLGHAPGLGKTPITLAVLQVISVLDELNFAPRLRKTIAKDEPDDYFNPSTLLGNEDAVFAGGPCLVVSPVVVIGAWVANIRKFLGPHKKVVIAHGKPTQAERAHGGRYEGCYCVDDILTAVDMPAPEEFDEFYNNKGIVPNQRPKRLTIAHLLELRGWQVAHRSDKYRPESWIVITAPLTLGYRLGLYEYGTGRSFKANPYVIDVLWSYVVVDEIHEQKTWGHIFWRNCMQLPGCPQYIFLSGTYMSKVADLIGPLMTAESPYLRPVNEKDGSRIGLDKYWGKHENRRDHKVSPLDRHIPFTPNISPEMEKWFNENGFRQVAELAGKIDHRVAKRGKLSVAASKAAAAANGRDEDDLDVTDLDNGTKELIKSLGAILKNFVIQFDTDLVWRPLPHMRGFPAIDVPPHATFDIHCEIPEKFKDALYPLWRKKVLITYQTSNRNDNFAMQSFLDGVRVFRIHTLFPCLLSLTQADPELAEELGNFDGEVAETITKLGRNSKVYQVMDHIHELPTMAIVRTHIKMIRARNSYLGQPKKCVLSAFLPFNVAIIHLYLLWLAELPSYTAINTDDDIVSVVVRMNQNDRATAIQRFKTTEDITQYSDQPFVMIAAATCIKSGIDLVPADNLMLVDADWSAAFITQVLYRVRRSKKVQKAPFTEGYRIISSASWCILQKWMAGRQCTTAMIQEEVRGLQSSALPLEDTDRYSKA